MLGHSALPFDDVRQLIEKLPPLATATGQKHDLRHNDLVMSETIAPFSIFTKMLCESSGQHPVQILRPELAIFAGSHGIQKHEGFSEKDTNLDEMLEYLQQGTAPINQLCASLGAGLKIFEVGCHIPTDDITQECAMSEKEATTTIAYGMEATSQGADLLIIASLSHVSDFIAKIVASYLIEGDYHSWFEDDIQKETFDKIRSKHDDEYEALETIRHVGGREIAAMVGAIIAARYQSIPVILDGFSSLIAALIIKNLKSDGIKHCVIGHISENEAFNPIVEALDIPIVSHTALDNSCGIGGVMGLSLLKSMVLMHNFSGHKTEIKVKQPA